jgi:FG-GAP repeat
MRMRHHIELAVLVYLTLLSSQSVRAQFAQQGPKFVGTGAVGKFIEQGHSVSLSADGNTAIVGGNGDSTGTGAAWVWTRRGGIWTQQSAKLVGSGVLGIPFHGSSVSLSADGNTAMIGGPGDNSGAGGTWIWMRSGAGWTQKSTKLVGSGAVGNALQGSSGLLSGDGNTAIVGGPGDNGSAGAVWVWTRSGGAWIQQGTKLVGSGAVGNANQGWSVGLSADGNTAIVGGNQDNTISGAAWVWIRRGGTWTQQVTKLVGSGASEKAQQGFSVALSADGNTAIVGGPGDNSDVGAAWIWIRKGGVWTQQATKLVGSEAAGNSQQGSSVAISASGDTAIVGGAGDNGGRGAVWVWTRSGEVWTQREAKLVGSEAVGSAFQGYSVSLSADGNTALIGGNGDNKTAGAAWVFASGTNSRLQQRRAGRKRRDGR